MKLKDFISELKADIKLVLEKTKEEDNEEDVLVAAESSLSLDPFLELVDYYEKTAAIANEEATPENLNQLKVALAVRWDAIFIYPYPTDAIYPHSPKSRINQVCIVIANHLAKIFKLHPYQLLMPTLKFTDKNLALKLSEFIIRDDCRTPLEVKDGLLDKSTLTGNEAQRLILHHSDEIRKEKKIDDTLFGKNESNVNERLTQTIRNDECKVTASYEEIGEKCLIASILSTTKNVNDLVDLMIKHLNKERWKIFLEKLSSLKLVPEFLFRIIFQNHLPLIPENITSVNDYQQMLAAARKKLPQVISSTALPNYEDDSRARAMFLCFAMVYKTIREAEKDFTTSLGQYFGFRLFKSTTYCKDTKVTACERLIDFIAGTEDLEKIRDQAFFKEFERPLYYGALGSITKLITDYVDKKIEAKKTTEVKLAAVK